MSRLQDAYTDVGSRKRLEHVFETQVSRRRHLQDVGVRLSQEQAAEEFERDCAGGVVEVILIIQWSQYSILPGWRNW